MASYLMQYVNTDKLARDSNDKNMGWQALYVISTVTISNCFKCGAHID